MPQVVFDKQDQLQKIQAHLVRGEQLLAVFDLKGVGTGFVGITTKRLIFYDKAFLRKIRGTITVPLTVISSVAAHDASGLFTGRGFFSSSTLSVTTPHGEHHFEFRGAEKAHVAYRMIVAHMIGTGDFGPVAVDADGSPAPVPEEVLTAAGVPRRQAEQWLSVGACPHCGWRNTPGRSDCKRCHRALVLEPA